jgi:ribonuclease HI
VTADTSLPLTEIILHIDGACRGNPGEAGYGVSVTAPDGSSIAELYSYLGHATNNVAEYHALLQALRFALYRNARTARVFSDSELVVKQMHGQYRVKHPDLIPLHREAQALWRRIPQITLTHVRREQNKAADRLANRALDEKRSHPDIVPA